MNIGTRLSSYICRSCWRAIQIRWYKSNPLFSTSCFSKFLVNVEEEFASGSSGDSSKLGYLKRILDHKAKWIEQKQMLDELEIMIKESDDAELKNMALKDKDEISDKLEQIESKLVESIVPADPLDHLTGVMLEVSSGAGGQEAMLFAKDISEMYRKYALSRGWSWNVIDDDSEDKYGGLRNATFALSGRDVYRTLKFETGVHRVQRVPVTQGNMSKIHTSTMVVTILPEPDEIEVDLKDRDIKFEAMRSSVKAGGQHLNTTSTAVRLTHLPTGTIVFCQRERSQPQNLKIATQKLGTLLFNRKVDAQNEERQRNRTLQIGSKGRSEKIRTYNYQQDRITDHRIRNTAHKIADFMNAGSSMQNMFDCLQKFHYEERLQEILNQFDN